MISDRLTLELIAETTLEDISENYRPVVEIIGIEKFIELSDYAKGDELYFPKVENVIAPARNRRIKKEWDGYNSKELAENNANRAWTMSMLYVKRFSKNLLGEIFPEVSPAPGYRKY